MNIEEICEELTRISVNELTLLQQLLPDDADSCFGLFTEMTRVSDYWGLGHNHTLGDTGVSVQIFDIMKMGWNLAASLLYQTPKTDGFPFHKSTETTRNDAAVLLYKFGCINLLKRTMDMLRAGILSVDQQEGKYIFRKSEVSNSQYLDHLEFSNLEDLSATIEDSIDKTYAGWNLVERKHIPDVLMRVGNFLSFERKINLTDYLTADIETVMTSLIKPKNLGYGVMLSYGATLEIDNHFLALATELVIGWRDEAGLHPDIKIGRINSRDLIKVIIFIVSLHLKHIRFASLAAEKYPEILIPQSLTLWERLDKMIRDIAEFSGMDPKLISDAFDILMLKPSDATFLRTHTSKFMPLMLDIGNGWVLRPVSSIILNPLISILSLLEHRNPNIRHSISAPREDWLRKDLYALFLGVRYQRVKGSIKLRQGKDVMTDIDAAIYDNLTGELALFQIKWQDYFFNDVKKLRSKASNLTKDLDEWVEKVTQWVNTYGLRRLTHDLGIRTVPEKTTSIYLFGISRNAARMQGYGFRTTTESLAISNWPQFIRNRTEIGPAPRVFHTLFETLRSQEEEPISPKPMPIEINVSGKVMRYEDLWSSIQD